MSSNPPDSLEAALAEVERVAKRQKTCAAKTSGVLYKIIHLLEKCVDKLSNSKSDGRIDVDAELNALRDSLMALEPVSTLSSNTKELHGAVARLGKIIDKEFSVDMNGALPEFSMDLTALDTAVSEHLYREGLFEIGDVFAKEAHLHGNEIEEFKIQYEILYNIMKDLEERRLDSALAWVQSNKNHVCRRVGKSSFKDLEFCVHRLVFMQKLEKGDSKKEALQYARQNFPDFVDTHLEDVQDLMGMLCTTVKHGNALTYKKYYGYYVGDGFWTEFSGVLKEHIFDVMNKSQSSPLAIAVAAGAASLPTLAKLAAIFAKTQPASELAGEGQLPMEVPLGPEFVFHSIFACPVSREQSSPENPPMMLPCGHCICKQSVIRIAKSANRAFKCPYCPKESTLQMCMELHLN